MFGVKRTYTLFLVFFLAMLLFASTTQMSAQEDGAIGVNPNTQSTDAYQFPILPGSTEWQALQTHDEMVAVTQIPVETLSTISTHGLAMTVLDYPLLADIWAFDSVQQGFSIVTNNFNGLQELLVREDAGRELLILYEQMAPSSLDSLWSLEQQGYYVFDIVHLEFLLAQQSVLDTLSDDERGNLQRLALHYYEQKMQLPDTYGRLSVETTAVLMGRLAYYSTDPSVFTLPVVDEFDYPSYTETEDAGTYPAHFEENVGQVESEGAMTMDPVIVFLQQGTYASDEVLKHIEDLVRQGVADNVSVPLCFAPDDACTIIYTPYGTAVGADLKTWELSQTEINNLNNYVAQVYPNATRETNASRKYNCHSYAWYSTSTSNNIWLNSPNEDTYWNDGSYQQVTSAVSGIKVSYPSSSDHSAIAVSSTQFRSKWGQLPRMLHAPSYSPYSVGTGLKYYRLASNCPTITAWQGEYWNPFLERADCAVMTRLLISIGVQEALV